MFRWVFSCTVDRLYQGAVSVFPLPGQLSPCCITGRARTHLHAAKQPEPKSHCLGPQKIFCGLMGQKLSLSKVFNPITSAIKLIPYQQLILLLPGKTLLLHDLENMAQ